MASSSTYSVNPFTDTWYVLTEAKRIVSTHSRHFLLLSVLLLLPLSFSLSSFPSLLFRHELVFSPTLSPSSLSLSLSLLHHSPSTKTLILSSLFSSLLLLLLLLLAIASVSHSVFLGFFGRPVKFSHSIRSLLSSFFPLLGTSLVVSLVFALFGLLAFRSLQYTFSFHSPFLFGVFFLFALLLGFLLLHLLVNFILVHVIVVVEGQWGFAPLIRSRHLIRGMRWVALLLILFFGFCVGVVVWITVVAGVDGNYTGSLSDGWNKFGFVLQLVGTSTVLTLLMLHCIASTTVLYMYCKALHGELAGEIAHEFAAEYVCLPFDDKKLPHVVSFVC